MRVHQEVELEPGDIAVVGRFHYVDPETGGSRLQERGSAKHELVVTDSWEDYETGMHYRAKTKKRTEWIEPGLGVKVHVPVGSKVTFSEFDIIQDATIERNKK